MHVLLDPLHEALMGTMLIHAPMALKVQKAVQGQTRPAERQACQI